MFDRRRHDPSPRRRPFSHAANRKVIRLGSAAGEDYLARRGSDKPCDPLASVLELAPGALAASMDRRGVSRLVRLGKAGDREAHLGSQRRTGIVVKINTHTGLIGPRRTNNLA